MKKIKIFFINMLLIILIMEFLSFLMIRQDSIEFVSSFNESAKKNKQNTLSYKYAPVRVFDQKKLVEKRRDISFGDKDKGTVVFFGCSYMFGAGLKYEETLPYVFNKMSGITAVNMSISGGSILNTLNDLMDDDFYKRIKRDCPEPVRDIVYLYINDHLNRIINPYLSSVIPIDREFYQINPFYDVDDENNLHIKNPPKYLLPFYSLFITKAYYYFYRQKFSEETKEEKMLKLFKAAKKITDKKFNNPNFIILVYKDGSHYGMHKDFMEKLEANGFKVIDSEDLAGHELDSLKWRGEDKEHPNAASFYDVAKNLTKVIK